MLKKYKNKIWNQELYQGKYIKKDNYFEGWYFKHVTSDYKVSISFIVGITHHKDDKHSFIQILDNIENKSYYLKFDFDDFKYNDEPFFIEIKNNIFSFEKINVNIKYPIQIKANLEYDKLAKIDKNLYSPNVMGPFAYLTFMECNHSVISIRHKLKGYINIYDKYISFDSGTGYIEKDYGVSFPKKYLWIQSNSTNNDSSIFLAIANIPFSKFNFKGFISILEIEGKQYRFSTYNFGKIKKLNIEERTASILITQGNKSLEILLGCSDTMELVSPKNGEMKDTVKESLNSIISVRMYIKNKLTYENTFVAGATEIFNY